MLDSQGNKVFASLSEDGKGGDLFQRNVSYWSFLRSTDFKIYGIKQ